MNIPFECDRRVFMTEDFREGFDIHSALDGARRKGVAQSVETVMGNLLLFKEQFKAALIGTNRNDLTAVPYHVL